MPQITSTSYVPPRGAGQPVPAVVPVTADAAYERADAVLDRLEMAAFGAPTGAQVASGAWDTGLGGMMPGAYAPAPSSPAPYAYPPAGYAPYPAPLTSRLGTWLRGAGTGLAQGTATVFHGAVDGLAGVWQAFERWLSPGAVPGPGRPPRVPHAPKPPHAPKHPQKPHPAPSGDRDRLKHMSTTELARLGRTDKKAFFDALRPAAEAAQRQYGVPAAVIMAQAALETGWGSHLAAGHNLFGHKGTGPAGTNRTKTWEVVNGRNVTVYANFARYHNFDEAVVAHGKWFHNGYYDKAVKNYARYHDAARFARDITGIYATDPSYGAKLTSIMRQYRL